MEPIVDIWLDARVDVAVVQFAVEDEEDLVWGRGVSGGIGEVLRDAPSLTRGAMTSASGHSVLA